MSKPQPDTEVIRQTLDRQVECAKHLVAVMERERQALTDNNVIALEQISSEKLTAATQLQMLSTALEKINAGPTQLRAVIAQAADGTALKLRWDELLKLAAQCARFNLSNGALLDERQAQLRRTRRAIGGQSPQTYGRRGYAGFEGGRHRLASA